MIIFHACFFTLFFYKLPHVQHLRSFFLCFFSTFSIYRPPNSLLQKYFKGFNRNYHYVVVDKYLKCVPCEPLYFHFSQTPYHLFTFCHLLFSNTESTPSSFFFFARINACSPHYFCISVLLFFFVVIQPYYYISSALIHCLSPLPFDF